MYSLSDICAAYLGRHWNDSKNYQNRWEALRWQSSVVTAPHLKKAMQPKQIAVFPWEKKKNSKALKGTPANPWTKSELEKLKHLPIFN